jgi:hypothetical protein
MHSRLQVKPFSRRVSIVTHTPSPSTTLDSWIFGNVPYIREYSLREDLCLNFASSGFQRRVSWWNPAWSGDPASKWWQLICCISQHYLMMLDFTKKPQTQPSSLKTKVDVEIRTCSVRMVPCISLRPDLFYYLFLELFLSVFIRFSDEKIFNLKINFCG